MPPRDRDPRQRSLDAAFGEDAGPPVLTVSELNRYVAGLLRDDDILRDVWVRGEVSNFKAAASGHMYFSLKDDGGQVSCAFFRRENQRLAFNLGDGLEVLARGRVGLYEVRGSYQLVVQEVTPRGKGELYLRFLQLREQLEGEGLFDPARKRAIPPYPTAVGVVTSGTGAAVRDVLDVAHRRDPGLHLVVHPVRVQGEGAADEIAAAIELFNARCPVDTLIVGRGGGSIEDLWAFNEEVVARAIAASAIPVVSAVGHETDFTIADFVADARAPTPSAAAEIAVPDTRALLQTVRSHEGLLATHLTRVAESLAQRTDEASSGLGRALETLLERKGRDVAELARVLDSLSPLKVLDRGYAVTERRDTGALVRSVADADPGDPLRVRLTDGALLAEVTGKEDEPHGT